MRNFGLIALAAFLLFALTTQARAALIDPNIFVSQSTSSYSGDPNMITDVSGFYVGWVDNSHSGTTPLQIIVGVPDATTASAPTVSYGGNDYFFSSSALFSKDVQKNTGDVYEAALGVAGNNSENWTNWTSTSLDASVTNFELYVYTLPDALTQNNTPFTLDLGGTVTPGSYVIAYDTFSGGYGATPFTTAGYVVPEPSSLLLIGLGLIAFAGLKRKMKIS